MTRRKTVPQLPLFDIAAYDEAQRAQSAEQAYHAAERVRLEAECEELRVDRTMLSVANVRLAKERDILSAECARLQSENYSLKFQVLLQQSRMPSAPPETLLLDLLKLSHPDRWSQGQAATVLAHEITVALNAAREKYHDA